MCKIITFFLESEKEFFYTIAHILNFNSFKNFNLFIYPINNNGLRGSRNYIRSSAHNRSDCVGKIIVALDAG